MKTKNALVMVFWATVLFVLPPQAFAFPQYSVDRVSGNCADCHDNFLLGSNYISRVDGTAWNVDLHDGHRTLMLSGDCNACHSRAARFPVILNYSEGGAGFQPIGCMGCHGRSEDAGGDGLSPGWGRGLRQHHQNTGVTSCAGCHSDATGPAGVAENIPPPYYFTPDANHPDKPTSACDFDGSESPFGTVGLDNDGDGLYDNADPDCAIIPNIAVDPLALDFDLVLIGNRSTLTSRISNTGNADLVVTSISPAAGTSAEFSFAAPSIPFVVPPFTSEAVTVTYAPVDIGPDAGSLELISDDPDQPLTRLNLTGRSNVAPTPDINLNPVALDFGTVTVGGMATLNSAIQNLGDADLTVTAIRLCAGTSSEFAFTALPTPFRLAPRTAQTLTVVYAPADVGPDRGCIDVASDDPDEGLVQINLAGSGLAPPAPPVGGSVVGMTPLQVICRNLDTRQTVIIRDGSKAYDCEAAGLAVSPGNRIDVIVKGTAD